MYRLRIQHCWSKLWWLLSHQHFCSAFFRKLCIYILFEKAGRNKPKQKNTNKNEVYLNALANAVTANAEKQKDDEN